MVQDDFRQAAEDLIQQCLWSGQVDGAIRLARLIGRELTGQEWLVVYNVATNDGNVDLALRAAEKVGLTLSSNDLVALNAIVGEKQQFLKDAKRWVTAWNEIADTMVAAELKRKKN